MVRSTKGYRKEKEETNKHILARRNNLNARYHDGEKSSNADVPMPRVQWPRSNGPGSNAAVQAVPMPTGPVPMPRFQCPRAPFQWRGSNAEFQLPRVQCPRSNAPVPIARSNG